MAISLASSTIPSINRSLAASKASILGSKDVAFFKKSWAAGRVPAPIAWSPNRTAVRCSAEALSDAHAGFPPDFLFGAASSAFQVEGATKEGGRGASIWDTFCEEHPDKIADGSNGDPGAGSYLHYKEDVQRLVDLGATIYRFSISWSRILPDGRGNPNDEGVQYYNNLIQELLDHGIQPFVTLFHWDVPQKLEDEYGGFLSRRILKDYKYFVDVCFEKFGDKVKHWITMNEPLTFTTLGYGTGVFAPGHCTPDLTYQGQTLECPVGDSLREPYVVGHNILLAHAEAVQLYKEKYKAKQGGKVGITLVSNWFVPYDNSPLSKEAQQRALEFNLGWFMDPLKFGDYPFSMRSLVRERLPKFTTEESEKLKDSFDFIGLNYYTSRYARNKVFDINDEPIIYQDDGRYDALVDKDGVPIGYAETNSWVNVYPKGLKALLLYLKERYDNPEIYITENGVMELQNSSTTSTDQSNIPANKTILSSPVPKELNDTYRAQYHANHLQELVDAMRSGVKLRGYFVWSLLDSFEWASGYTSKFGLHRVNINNDSKSEDTRIPKRSATWFKWFLSVAKSNLPSQDEGKTTTEDNDKETSTITPLRSSFPINKKTT